MKFRVVFGGLIHWLDERGSARRTTVESTGKPLNLDEAQKYVTGKIYKFESWLQ